MSRFVKMILLLMIFGGAGYAVWQRVMGAGGPPPGAMMAGGAAPVGVEKVVARDVKLWNEFSGRLVAVDVADVRPRVSGIVEGIHFKDGALVAKDDLLFTVDPRPYKAAFDSAGAQLAAARARAASARRELDRARQLFKAKALSQKDFDQRQSDADVADASVRIASAALEVAKLDLDYTQIRAPISGRIGRAEVTQGNLVSAGMGAAPVLATIVSIADIYADFDMDEAAFLHYAAAVAGDGTTIPVRMGLMSETGTPREGHIVSFDNRLNVSSGTVRARAVFPNPDHALVPGLFARLSVGSAAPRRVLLVSDRAIGTDQDKKFVLLVGEGNKAEYRPVRPGQLVEGLRIVEEGLKEGDEVIVSGLQRVRPGMPVRKTEDGGQKSEGGGAGSK